MSKTILITGAATGLGKGTALGLARVGHQVIAAVEIWPQVTALREEAEKEGVDLQVIKLDLLSKLDREHAQRLDIDILVNNAGIGESGPVAEISVDLVRRVFEVNVFGALELTQGFARKMVERRSGKIIFMSSIAGLAIWPFLAAYCASKHALEAVADCMKEELAPFNVKVATINPGPYRTGFNDRMFESYHQWFDPSRNFTSPDLIERVGEQLDEGQFDPQGMIDKMIEVIPAQHHFYRTMEPGPVVLWTKDYQAKKWTETV